MGEMSSQGTGGEGGGRFYRGGRYLYILVTGWSNALVNVLVARSAGTPRFVPWKIPSRKYVWAEWISRHVDHTSPQKDRCKGGVMSVRHGGVRPMNVGFTVEKQVKAVTKSSMDN